MLRSDEMVWQDDTISLAYDGTLAFGAANNARVIGACSALRGATEQTREWYAKAACMFAESVRQDRPRRDKKSHVSVGHEPGLLSSALDAALVGQDEATLREVTTCALEMDDTYLTEAYLEGYADPQLSVLQFFNTKAKAALVAEDDRAETYIDELETRIDDQNASSPYWQAMPTFYRGLLTDAPVNAQTGLGKLVEGHESSDTDSPSRYVATEVGGCVLLARRYGMDLSVESDRVPEALVAEEIPADDTRIDLQFDFEDVPEDETPPDLDVETLECTKSGVFELYQDEDGNPVIAGRMYHASPEPVSAADVPDQGAGRLLSDEWVETTLAEAERRDYVEEELVTAARDAYAEGTLDRELVVVQDRTDGGTFDESVAELPIDGVEIVKGAARQ